MTVVEQIIRYEKEPPTDAEYYSRITFAASMKESSEEEKKGHTERLYIQTMEEIRDYLLRLGFDVDRVYVSKSPNLEKYWGGEPIPDEVKNALVTDGTETDILVDHISDGRCFICYRGHGIREGWCDPQLHIGDLNRINGRTPSIFFILNCHSKAFDADPSECFAEALLLRDGGAPSLIASTEVSSSAINNDMARAVFDALYPGLLHRFQENSAVFPVKYHRLGDILNYALAYSLLYEDDGRKLQKQLEMYHVIGDPTLQLWVEKPRPVDLHAFIHEDRLYIYFSPCPAEAVITIWYMNVLLKRFEPSSTRLTVSLREYGGLMPSDPGIPAINHRIKVCVSAPGHLFTQAEVDYYKE